MSSRNSLYWITNDLRIDDNELLQRAKNADLLICLYCVDPKWFKPWRYHVAQMGKKRWQFLQEGLADLHQRLAALGQRLFIVHQAPEEVIPTLCQLHNISDLLLSRQFGFDERRALASIEKQQPHLSIFESDHATLLPASELELGFPNLKGGFTPFKNRALMVLDDLVQPLPAVKRLPPAPRQLSIDLDTSVNYLPTTANDTKALFKGGETQAQSHIINYLSSDALSHYKQTRNALMGFTHSSKLSAWLNSGALSVRQVHAQVCQYEQKHGRNESSQWMIFELLWREYFHWLSLSQSQSLFTFKGLRKNPPLTGYYAERFQKWSQGNTAYPLVNACMRELNATGYLSNRGRQIAASCFVNELQLDWRYGAAWFEHNLLDYQVSVNWGNWQYIAGVGVDPRGGRHFNIEKQQKSYDPDKYYINTWCGHEDFSQQASDSVDAADWPNV